jgi:hypothetical protein
MGAAQKKRKLTFKSVAWLIAGGIVISTLGMGEEADFLPQARHVRVFTSRGDCSIYSAVKSKTEGRYRELTAARNSINEIAKQRRESLVKCGASSEESRRALQEDELADQCPQEYRDWIKAGEIYLTNKVEIQETYRNLQSLAGLISYYCGKVSEPHSIPAEN